MLEILAKNHDLWLRMVLSFGCPKDVAEDIVHEMYLNVYKYVEDDERIMYDDDEVNKFYIFVSLRNLYFSYAKAKSKYRFVDIYEYIESNDIEDEETDEKSEELDRALGSLIEMVSEEINSWDVYHAKLCNTYFKSDMSLRDISSISKISLTSIFNSVKNYRKILKDKFMEDVEDFFNGDFHLIKKKSKHNGNI